MMIELDSTTAAFVGMLRESLNNEPPYPDTDRHEGHHLAEIAMRHYEWERHNNAVRLLIAVRVTDAALRLVP